MWDARPVVSRAAPVFDHRAAATAAQSAPGAGRALPNRMAIAAGEEIGAFALTEPQSGSDATAMRCRAVKQADGTFVVNGKKSWITSGPVATYIVLFAMTDPTQAA